MKLVSVVTAFALAASQACADPTPAHTRAVQQGYDEGWHDCAPALDKVIKFIHPDDNAYAMFGHWSKDAPNTSMFTTLTKEGQLVTTFSATKNTAGSCDVVVTQIGVSGDSCTKVHDDDFKDWKSYGDLDGSPIYEDPTAANDLIILTPIAAGCLLTKQIFGFGM
jgi:hypothetical protein